MYPHGMEQRFHAFGLDTVFGSLRGFVEAAQWQQFRALKYQIEAMRLQPEIAGLRHHRADRLPLGGERPPRHAAQPARLPRPLRHRQRRHGRPARVAQAGLLGGRAGRDRPRGRPRPGRHGPGREARLAARRRRCQGQRRPRPQARRAAGRHRRVPRARHARRPPARPRAHRRRRPARDQQRRPLRPRPPRRAAGRRRLGLRPRSGARRAPAGAGLPPGEECARPRT